MRNDRRPGSYKVSATAMSGACASWGSTAMIISRQLIKSAAIAVATLAATSGSSFAGGEVVYANGIRQGAAAVPVPAPVPVPDVSTGYYLRIDAAYSRGDVGKYWLPDVSSG